MEKIEDLEFKEIFIINGGYVNPAPGISPLGLITAGITFLRGFSAGSMFF